MQSLLVCIHSMVHTLSGANAAQSQEARATLDCSQDAMLNRTRVCVLFMQQFLKPAPKSAEEEAYLRNMLRDHPQFRLSEPKLAVALSYFRRQEVSEGETLIPQVGPLTPRLAWLLCWQGAMAQLIL